MKTIEISRQELVELLEHAQHGSTDWDIYVKIDGELAERHNTHNNNNWYELIDLYCTNYDNAENYTTEDWVNLVDDWDFSECKKNIELDINLNENWDRNEDEKISIELIKTEMVKLKFKRKEK